MEPSSSKKRKLSLSPPPSSIGKRGKPTNFPLLKELCECTECRENPGYDPEFGLPISGRWIDEVEYKDHCKREKDRGVAYTRLPLLSSPEIVVHGLTESGQHSSSQVRPLSPSGSGDSTTSLAPPPRNTRNPSPETPDYIIRQINELQNQLLPATEIVNKNCVIFKTPPGSTKLVRDVGADAIESEIKTLSRSDLDLLCALDPNISANSPVIGYQEMLVRMEKYTSSVQKAPPSTRARLKSELLFNRVDQETRNLRQALLAVWISQRLQAKAGNSHDTCKHTFLTTTLVLVIYTKNMPFQLNTTSILSSHFIQSLCFAFFWSRHFT